MSKINLTRAIEQAVADLKKARKFSDLYVINAWCQSETQKLADCESDGLGDEETRAYIEDYAYIGVHLDVYDLAETHSEYVTTEFNWRALREDFKNWLLPYIGGDESLLPSEIDLEGHEMELQRK